MTYEDLKKIQTLNKKISELKSDIERYSNFLSFKEFDGDVERRIIKSQISQFKSELDTLKKQFSGLEVLNLDKITF